MINVPTYEELLERCLASVPNNMSKIEGSLIYDALAPACLELAQAYIELERVRDITYADTSTGEYLTRRCNERAVYRKQATKAIRKGQFNIEVQIGTRFSLKDTTYRVIKHIRDFEYELQCEQAGTQGNIYFGEMTAIDFIEGLKVATLADLLVPGEDEESDESLRARYFKSLDDNRFGGNVADYLYFTNELDGVGGVKVYPAWNGGGTVKVVIIDSDYNKPSEKLVNDVQTAIDPIPNQGIGKGIAPIGHTVSVCGVGETVINISTHITFQEGYTWEDVKPRFIASLKEYFKEVQATWADTENVVIRTSYIETRALNVVGVLDIQHTSINGLQQNAVIDKDNIPVLGEVALT